MLMREDFFEWPEIIKLEKNYGIEIVLCFIKFLNCTVEDDKNNLKIAETWLFSNSLIEALKSSEILNDLNKFTESFKEKFEIKD